MEDKKNNELRSRREFFKKAAKGALPILGAIVLAGSPFLSYASDVTNCQYSCSAMCQDSCTGGCKGDCTSACARGCSNTCNAGCDIRCYKSAY